jgi:Carboxypeptidase regulatory-like domain
MRCTEILHEQLGVESLIPAQQEKTMRNFVMWTARTVVLCGIFTLAVVVAAVSSSAQTFRGTILGTVTDASGAAVAGATVTVHNVDTGIERTMQTAMDGSYLVPELPIGNYTLTIKKTGFQKSVTQDIKVDVATELRVDVALRVGASAQQIVVSGETLPQVNTTMDTLGGVLTQDTVKDLPINGRDYTKLIFLTPGAAGSPDEISDSPGSYGEFSMNGARGRSNNYLLDGTDMNDGYRNDPAINQAGVFGTPSAILPIDAVAELNVLSNFQPEFGRNGGAVVNIVTKSGGNEFHSDVFEYFRNNALDARNFFNDVGQPQAPFHNNQFGGSLGGPIVRDKAFFFADYEGQRETVGVVSLACVPNPSDLVTTNPVIKDLLAHYPNNDPWPLPNIAANAPDQNGCPSGPDTSVTAPSFNNLTSAIAKVDYNFNQSNTLSGRYFVGDSVQAFPLALTGGGILPGFDTSTPTRVQLVSISYVRVISPTKVNEARLGWNRFAEGFDPEDMSFHPDSVGLCAATSTADCTGSGPSNSGLPVINVGSFAQLGASHTTPRHRFDSNWQAFDNFSWKFGKHDVKVGYEFRRTTIQQFFGVNFRGSLKFNGDHSGTALGDFLSGYVDSGGESTGQAVRHTFQDNDGLYIQDSFQLSSRLTFSYGLRWDYYGVFSEENHLASNITNFDTAAQTVTLTQVGQPGLGELYNPDYRNFAPRLSIAWDPLGHGKMVIRAGYGIFYDAFSQDFFMGQVPYNSVFDPGPTYNPFGPAPIFSVSAVGGPISTGVPIYSAPGTTPAGDIFSVDRNVKTPYMENYNLNLQQQITNKIALEIGYVGSEGHRLFHFVDLNQPTLGAITQSDLATANATPGCVVGGVVVGGPGCITPSYSVPRPFQDNPYGAFYINNLETTARSNYNSLQTSLHIAGWHGITSTANYVWSHSLDTASDGFEFIPNAAMPNDSTHPNLEYANSNFDIRNRFTWIFGYDLPHRTGSLEQLKNGWGVDSTVTMQDGQPFQLNYNFEDDFSGSGEGYDRPDAVGPIQYNFSNPFEYLNLTSFAIPCTITAAAQAAPTGTAQDCLPGTRHFGDEGRDSLRGPTFKEWDFALYKNTRITERLAVQFRAEFFNILNHPNFANPFLPAFISDPAINGFTIDNGREVGSNFFPIGATGDVGIGNPFLGGGAPRGIQLAAKFSF